MEKIKFYIQFFAEGEENEAPVENTENEADNSEESSEDDVDFDNTTTKEEEKDKKSAKTPEEKEKNRQNFQRRIQERQRKQEEERKKQLEIEKRKSYIDGVKKSTNGVNKFTQEPIEDDDDVAEYELMLKLEREGKDPIEDYAKAVKEQRRAERQKLEAEKEAEQKAQKDLDADVQDFVSKYGAETAQALSKDAKFQNFAMKFFGKVPLSDIYETYLTVQTEIESQSNKKALEKDARRVSSSGGLGKGNEPTNSIKGMSNEEFAKFTEAIRNKI